MSEEIGPALPPPLRFELGAHPAGEAVKAALLLTVDADGAQRVAVLAPAQVKARDASHIALRLHASSSACANVKRTQKAALWYVLDAAAYCIRGEMHPADEPGNDREYEAFDLEITSVLRDFHASAPMVSGPTYKRI
ncbi:MAG: hypothetical protein JOY87_04920 [Candidatus Eremiobacteraeota bacterium]|nr:hypothetical protein [Candidatus Eremiobacteraeota bacterium]